MPYDVVLLDLDLTIYASEESELQAFAHTAAFAGLTDPDSHFDRYLSINRELWAAVERGELLPTELRYRRFEQFILDVGLDTDIRRMADEFVWGLGAYGELYPGAERVLAQLATTASLALVTNGLGEVQRARLSRLGITDYFDVIVVSGEVGVTKPRPEIFQIAFEQLGNPPKESALMVGDSLTSDIAGGRNFGIDTCWYNPHGATDAGDIVATHQIAALEELVAVVSGHRS